MRGVVMDLEKSRLQWDDPEFAKSFARLDEKDIFGIIERMEGRERKWGRSPLI
jgi:hypothetical protein